MNAVMDLMLERLDKAGAMRHRDALADVLVDTVHDGASIGFLSPLSRETASTYWSGVFEALDDDLMLWIVSAGGKILGTVQLSRCTKQNGRHRAELQKLLVHPSARGRGIATQLVSAAEAQARAEGCTLLVLDTEAGSLAETLYRRLGWRKSGEIPRYAGKPGGELIPTAYYFKWIGAPPQPLELVRPASEHLPGYIAALKAGWSFDNLRGSKAADEALERIEKDTDLFLEMQVDREARGPAITMPDGSKVPRIPGFISWMWDGEFCGVIGFRWQPGTTALPSYVLGHIGYAVVPWKRQLGYARRALGLMLEHVRHEGLAHVEITCDVDNVASQRTIVGNGGILVERFTPPPACGNAKKLRYRIEVGPAGSS
jgi:predicted acetyltransferase